MYIQPTRAVQYDLTGDDHDQTDQTDSSCVATLPAPVANSIPL